MKAWAICDTDGGRMPPEVMCRYIYPAEASAKLKAQFDGFDHKYYPIMEVEITIKEGKDHGSENECSNDQAAVASGAGDERG